MLLKLTILFLVMSVITAIFAFSGVATQSESVMKSLFVIFLIMFVVSAIINAVTDQKTNQST